MNKMLKENQSFCTNMQPIFNEHIIYSMTDNDGIITNVSNAFCKETGYKRKEMIGKTHSFLRAPDFPDKAYDDLWETITKGKTWKGQINNIRKNGESYWIYSIIQPIFDNANGNHIGYIAIRQNITKEKQSEELSMIDELTGIYNRRKFNIELNSFLINFYRYNDQFSIVMIDIDYFKNFNDEYGHLIGDEVLKRMCYVIEKNIREGDLFSRWGGEEFVLILNKIDKKLAIKTCKKLLEKLRLDLPYFIHDNFFIKTVFTCSMGVTSPERSDCKDSLLSRADSAMYLAKDNGRNRIEIL